MPLQEITRNVNFSQPKQYNLPEDIQLTLEDEEHVWGPYSAFYFIDVLHRERILSNLQDNVILDLGTGSGILGIAALRYGAKHVTMVDQNDYAVQLAQVNTQSNFNGDNYDVINSDVFDDVKEKFDLIISNPPVQPEIPGIHTDNPAAKSNQAGSNGRYVLDRLLLEGSDHLKTGGKLIFSCSSRHGHRQTQKLLQEKWGEWRMLDSDTNGKEEIIDDDYHGPYMDYWLKEQAKDMDIRVYQKDKNGREVAITDDENGNETIIFVNTEGNTQRIIIKDGAIESNEVYINGQTISLEEENVQLPDITDNTWYYRFYLIEATKL